MHLCATNRVDLATSRSGIYSNFNGSIGRCCSRRARAILSDAARSLTSRDPKGRYLTRFQRRIRRATMRRYARIFLELPATLATLAHHPGIAQQQIQTAAVSCAIKYRLTENNETKAHKRRLVPRISMAYIEKESARAVHSGTCPALYLYDFRR